MKAETNEEKSQIPTHALFTKQFQTVKKKSSHGCLKYDINYINIILKVYTKVQTYIISH